MVIEWMETYRKPMREQTMKMKILTRMLKIMAQTMRKEMKIMTK